MKRNLKPTPQQEEIQKIRDGSLANKLQWATAALLNGFKPRTIRRRLELSGRQFTKLRKAIKRYDKAKEVQP